MAEEAQNRESFLCNRSRQIRQRQPAIVLLSCCRAAPDPRGALINGVRLLTDSAVAMSSSSYPRQCLVDPAVLPMDKTDHEVAQRLRIHVMAFHAQPVRFSAWAVACSYSPATR